MTYATRVPAGLPKGEEVGAKLSGCINVNILLLLSADRRKA